MTFWQRLRGVQAWRDWHDATWGLLLPRCTAIHTLGLEQALDVVFVTRTGAVIDVHVRLAPGRYARRQRAWGVLELPAGYCAEPGWAVCVSAAWASLKIDV